MKIGLLLPFSRFYPYIGSDIYNCLKYVLGDSHTYIIKDTHLSLPKENQNALKELLIFEQVDLVVGFVGYKSLTTINALIQQTKTPIILCNAGEHPILKADSNPYIVHCSLDMFNSIYFACKWAFQNLGKNYSRLLSFFDSGFPVAKATEVAAKNYKGEIKKTIVSHKNPQDDLKTNINLLENEDNDFIITSYHGFEALDIMKYLSENTIQNNTPLVSNPFSVTSEILPSDISNPIYTVKTWGNKDNKAYKTFETYFANELSRTPSFSGILGFEAALIIKHALTENWEKKEELAPKLLNIKVESPRGNLEFNKYLNSFNIDYELYKINTKEIKNEILMGQVIPDQADWETLNNFSEELMGWKNSYLCI